MTIRLQILIILGVIVGLMIFTNLVRKEKLELKYVLTWYGVLIGILIIGIFPKSIDAVSHALGVATPINALFFLGFIFVTCVLFFLTVVVSRSSIRVKELTQTVAIYQYENENMKKKLESMNDKEQKQKVTIE
ncbi:DUF2304 domain-containing protein [Bacillus cereus]|uniref:DUF2304 domain-containing protein n=1 Tax=Bacillus arachidis TaxID=2819290 RepID=A0ABS3NSD6_9BACI|nr:MULTISPECIES: DUF2304 domain-containing protein [Bacillus]PGX95985.1 DUF2304 domain-containing protein [Bacillus cereus]MBO1623673.1 DUF2304 domain-containing protein [Bacillus arachidis]PFE04846.1 DUF2304 domain-containing protein [Bacillus sp. AFS023182]WIY60868.1 DUF2304 domain-containing protein [Bacillus arachidis]SDZ30620.1 hypothetical protein SAMN04488156_11531 [Bacillus sp. 166amftsu]